MNSITFNFLYNIQKDTKGLKLPGVLEIKKINKLPHQTKLILVVILVGNGLISAILGQSLTAFTSKNCTWE